MTVIYGFSGSTRPSSVRTGGTLRFLLSDHLGSSSVTTDANGQTIGESLYKAFGETRYTLNNLYTDYHFTGQREQSELGIYWFQSRWYDGSLGRFLSPDSIVPTSAQGTQAWDRYAFVNNNPVRYNDPTGHRYCDYINSQNQEDCEAGQSRFDSSPKGSANGTYGNTFDINCSGKYKSDACLNDAAAGGNLENILPKDDDATKEPELTSPESSENQTMPLEERLLTLVFMVPLFFAADVALLEGTLAITAALALDPEPVTKAALLLADIGTSLMDVGMSVAEIDYLHWIITGKPVTSWNDLADWEVAP